ncbi:tyrosyl-tRNA synthetase [Sulfurihydrogenibium azorense Az-Fu1]|jgi:tyrosyl-tRNA synthetase|uniref:Tyrosine--tRNA ligase n=1 Tax=Sulfurihydrogenibium azorense (strain DSM 15241 / OCM 825 / Az-Fu1) TaxID=204536 RepID=C1DXE8_SULAA|nr:tyrosine--tRNA ligase [Sulfurihydrogenibium azorense]ACN98307.1 tyrosyl-tRNA synthetase [Sulfurihydrogenibium azorense Az-Fu1]MDM7273978.1 tyrosine--tRNA ligase [Sulfurihydrogenibium azorense]
MLSPEEQLKLIKKGTLEIISEEELLDKLKEGRPLIVKAGFDPTAPDLHLGHTVLLQKLRTFQQLGHTVYFIIGDFTAMIGDPSGRDQTRPPLTKQQVLENAKTYKEQVFKVLDPEKTVVVFNSSWLGEMKAEDLIKLTAKYTVARMLEREDFKKRFKENIPISIHEFIYPLLQAYDSVAIKADVELGGSDQRFNLLIGRDIQKEYGIEKPQVAILLPLLVGTDGVKKMSKSYGNYIGITEPPEDMFGKVMSISDELMWQYWELLTDLTVEEIDKMKKDVESGVLHPMEVKKQLAMYIVERFHDKDSAIKAKEHFEKVHSKKEIPDDIPVINVKDLNIEDKEIELFELIYLLNLAPSKAEAKRLIKQGGVKIDGEKVDDFLYKVDLTKEHIIQAGKRKFVKLQV